MAQMTLRAARHNVKMSQEKAAKEIGCSVSTIKKWEKGDTFPKQPMIEKICKVYGLSYDDIFFGSELAKSE